MANKQVWTRNYNNLWVLLQMPGYVAGAETTTKTWYQQESPKTPINDAMMVRTVHGGYMFVNHDYVSYAQNDVRLTQQLVAPTDVYSMNSPNALYPIVGTGTQEIDADTYTLANPVYGFTPSSTSSISLVDDEYVYTRTITLTNSTGSAVTVSELGLFGSVCCERYLNYDTASSISTTDKYPCLLYVEQLETPITVEPMEAIVFQIKRTVPIPNGAHTVTI